MKKLTAISTDAEIVKFLSGVNKKISGYYKAARDEGFTDDSVGEAFARRVEAALSYRKYEKGEFGKYDEWDLELVEKRGKLQIDLTTKEGKQKAIDHMRKILIEQQQMNAPKNISEKLDAMPTVAAKIKQVAKEMTESKSFTKTDEDEPMKLKSREETGMNSPEYNAYKRTLAITEMVNRAITTYETSFEDVINMLYEDEAANNDIISRLATERWDGELMEAANVRVIGYEPEED